MTQDMERNLIPLMLSNASGPAEFVSNSFNVFV